MGLYKTISFFESFYLVLHLNKKYLCLAIARLPKVFKKTEGSTLGLMMYKGKLSMFLDVEWRRN